MSFGAGMAAGIGAGVAIGMSTGARQSRDKLARSFECQGITLLDRQGKKISLDDALDHARHCEDSSGRTVAIVLIGLGLLLTMSLGVAAYFWVVA